MVDVAVLPAFIAVILLFLIPPGPDMAFMVAVGLERGRRAAVTAILGIGTGMSLYAAGAVAGIGQLAQAHPLLFDLVKLLGAGYLIWLGIGTLRSARRATTDHDVSVTARPYVRGLLISLTNPKIILFFVAVLPQFLGEAQNTGLQLAMLGAVNVMMEVVLYGAIGLLAGTFNARFASSGKGRAVLSYMAGAVYLVLAGVAVADVVSAGFFP
ncbi:LysE family transporter [Nesterenkonia sandarakina]|uniref:Threonine/homoserine/homoserine lactone efflux protein n=1 Tax=Nesterenkonia sandarakina TaxID=272918 RepID=A0A7Z0E6X7_9MICC|nr:threonine/homoserine/homoserine lactone efflux protein [Nesterenkonia sandarakina]